MRRVPLAEVDAVSGSIGSAIAGSMSRLFHQIARREHAVTLSYSYVKQALQTAGLVKKDRRAAASAPA